MKRTLVIVLAACAVAAVASINGLPGVVVEAPEGVMQTTAFEIEGDLIRALYVVRNPDKLRHLAAPRLEDGGNRREGNAR